MCVPFSLLLSSLFVIQPSPPNVASWSMWNEGHDISNLVLNHTFPMQLANLCGADLQGDRVNDNVMSYYDTNRKCPTKTFVNVSERGNRDKRYCS